MDQEKIGKFILNLRKKNNLTQKELANILGVTYQAVSKWETGKNIPDISILKRISEYFKIDISSILEGKKKKKNYKFHYLIIIGMFLILGIIFFLFKNNSFEFKSLTTRNSQFSVSGVAAYTKDKSSIYISNINYNGNDDDNYKLIECTLYEEYNSSKIKISTCDNTSNKVSSLAELLKNITFIIDDYSHSCNNLLSNDLYIEINALDENNKNIVYKVPLEFKEKCD